MRRVDPAWMDPHARLEAAERADPAGHAMHLAAAAAWGFAQSISNAAEGIAWGILLAVCVLRIPKAWRCWSVPLRSPLWLALAAWSSWIALSALWSPVQQPSMRDHFPDRWLLTPLMLWPVMGRAWVVLAAIAAGAFVQAGIAIALSWGPTGMARYMSVRSASAFGQLQWQLHCAVALGAAGIRWLPLPGRVASGAGLAAALVVVSRAATRITALSSVAAMAIVATRPPPRTASGRRARIAAVACLVALVAVAAFLPVGIRIRKNALSALRAADGDAAMRLVDSMTGHRSTLAAAALDIGSEHPWAGSGRGAFQALLPEWARERQHLYPEQATILEPLTAGTINDAHNAFLQSFVDAGVGAALLLAALLAGILVRLWRASRSDAVAAAALALLSAIVLGAFSHPIAAKAPGAIIAVCLAVAMRPAPRAPAAGPVRV